MMRKADAKRKAYRRMALFGELSILVIVFIGWRWTAHPERLSVVPGRMETVVVADADAITEPRSRDASAKRVPAVQIRGEKANDSPLPPPNTPHDIAIAQLKPMAEAGRTDAMRMLADKLYNCHVADRGSDAEIRRHSIDEILRFEQHTSNGEQVANETGWVESRIRQRVAIRDGCAQVAVDDAAHWLDWLDRAAAEGDTRAMIAYAEMALLDPRAHPEAWSADDVAQRKARAGAYLQKALDSGDCNAMMDLERAYDGDLGVGIFEPDPAMVYAIAIARWDWYRENHPDSDPELTKSWLEYLANAQAKVAEGRRAAAQQQGDALYARYCRGRPET